MKRFNMRPIAAIVFASSLMSLSNQAMAAAFQIWEQDGATVGSYHAGYAAEADNASIAWYNPAGITRFHNQQAVFGGVGIVTDFKFKGNVALTEDVLVIPPFPPALAPVTVPTPAFTAQGGNFSFVPDLHYVAPIHDRLGFGLSIAVPFGLKTNYGIGTDMRYAATLTSISVIDISPSLGYKMSDKASIGLGLDIQKANAEFDNVAGLIEPLPVGERVILTEMDSKSINKASDTGYGFHAGLLYEFNENSRVGLSYHSQVVHHFTGTSKLIGPIADLINEDSPIISRHARTGIKLPPYTALSVYNRMFPCLAFMGSVIYTQWNTFNTLKFRNLAAPEGFPPEPSTTVTVSIPQHYRNTFNVSLGANYYAARNIIVRGGVGYDKTPVSNHYRDARLPDSTRYALALGAHFQATPCVGLDVGWSHIFASRVKIDPVPQVIGPETVSTYGRVTGGADVISGQIVWNIT